jgi:pimeloyl-ACP methyl ester carboxylesterase
LNNVLFTKRTLDIPIGDILGTTGPTTMRGWVSAPVGPVGHIGSLVYCIAGGGSSTAYFDLQVDGLAGYSMADYLTARGAMVAAFDHPGVGASDPVPDLFEITPSIAARCHARAVREVVSLLGEGALVPGLDPLVHPKVVGVGHSMGGLVAAVQQSEFRSFEALVTLGHSGFGLPEVLTEAELALSGQAGDLLKLEHRIADLARTRFNQPSEVPRRQPAQGVFFAADVPPEVMSAFSHHAVPLLPTCGLAAMIPHSAGSQLASIDVPLLLCFGDQDLTGRPLDVVVAYPSATDVTVYVLPQSGHCHNQASGRTRLWGHILDWIEHLGPAAPGSGSEPARCGSPVAHPDT